MQVDLHQWYSPNLGQEMTLKVYGYGGAPILVFPTQGGRFYEYEDYGMVEACASFIDAGQVRLFAVDSVDHQAWANWNAHPAERGRRHNQYDRYITDEVVPLIRSYGSPDDRALCTGCSLGGYHAANFFFRHPDLFGGCIVLSGVFRLSFYVGDYLDDNVYFNSPLAYLPNLADPWYLELYRHSQIIVCVGQGVWEDEMLADTHALQRILAEHGVPAWIDYWGQDVNHDWPWWRKQMPYFLGQLNLVNAGQPG